MKRNRSNNSNLLADTVYNNLIRNYCLENNIVNMKKNVLRKHLIFRELLVYFFTKHLTFRELLVVFFFTSIYNVQSYRLKQNTCYSPNDDVLVRDTRN